MKSARRFGLPAFTCVLFLALSPAPALLAGERGAAGFLELVADGLDDPSNLASPSDGRGRIYVTDFREAEIRVVADGHLLPEVFLDLSDRIIADPLIEEGLLSLAFSPSFPERPYVYVTFVDVRGDLSLSRFEVMPSGLEAIASTEEVLLTIPRYGRVHHCGHIEFGPHDGMLYLCVGDTHHNYDVRPTAQDPSAPQGKLLRLDVEPHLLAGLQPIAHFTAPDHYEIRAMGLRNPWRFGFDPATDDLYIPDVGRSAWEEIDFLPAQAGLDANFGWPLAEGNDCVEHCDRADLIWPIYEYPHNDDHCAVIGGAVYRGSEFPEWQGVYVFSDQCSGEIWALRNPAGAIEVRKLAETDLMPSALGTRFDGEILIADSRAGAIWRLVLADIEGEWIAADEAMFPMVTQARRAKVGWTQERLDSITNTWTWQLLHLSKPLRIAYRQARKSLLALACQRIDDAFCK
jgi:glucose/arabinose dehydrogenase